jgi:hypothetical protein
MVFFVILFRIIGGGPFVVISTYAAMVSDVSTKDSRYPLLGIKGKTKSPYRLTFEIRRS